MEGRREGRREAGREGRRERKEVGEEEQQLEMSTILTQGEDQHIQCTMHPLDFVQYICTHSYITEDNRHPHSLLSFPVPL